MPPARIAGLTAGATLDGRRQIDGSACVIDGDRAFAVAEERITRVKHAGGCHHSLRAALHALNLRLGEIDLFVVSTCGEPPPPPGAPVYTRPDRAWTLGDYGVPADRILWCPSHHLSHALHGYHASCADRALVCVLDFEGNSGERNSYYFIDDGQARLLRRDLVPPTAYGGAGAGYAAVADLLGFDGAVDSGKVMALAALSAPEPADPKILEIRDGAILTTFGPDRQGLADLVRSALGEDAFGSISAGDLISRARLAAVMQADLEATVTASVASLLNAVPCDGIVLSGGVATNCKLLGALARAFPHHRVRAPFAPGDTGQSIGNVLWAMRRVGLQPPAAMRSPFLGTDIASFECQRLDDIFGATHRRVSGNAVTQAFRYIDAGGIVASACGRAEFGPRALGHRSFLARADDSALSRRLSVDIKGREHYRPLGGFVAGSIWPSGTWQSDFMELAVPATLLKTGTDSMTGIGSADGTVRFQTLRPDTSPVVSAVVERAAAAGISLINTSLNLGGAPIAEICDDILPITDRAPDLALLVGQWLLLPR